MANLTSFIEDNFVLIAGLAAAFKWIYEYSQQRKFEKNKFLLERIEKFYESEDIKIVQKLLDWNGTKIQYGNKEYIIDDTILTGALETHNNKSSFNQTEVLIRKLFDNYFDELNELVILYDCGLVDGDNLKKFLRYWIDILNGEKKNKPKSLISAIDKYLEFYGYQDVKDFIK